MPNSATPQGMTGFGSAEAGGLKVEVRSLNSRFLEINVRMPQGLMEQEIPIRNAIKERFLRGRLDVFVNVKAGGPSAAVSLDESRARELFAALEGLRKELSIGQAAGMPELLMMKEFFVSEEGGYDGAALMDAFRRALSELEAMRVREGLMIKDDVLKRVEILERIGLEIEAFLPEAVLAIQRRFLDRLKSLLSEVGYDEARLVQEAAIIAEKADITEELTRIKGFVGQVRKILENGDKIGRELDFLLQELHREANTISSKTEDMEILGRIVQFKTEVERVRQQIQNLQ